MNSVMTIGGFLDLVKPLSQLPPETPLTIGVGCAILDPNGAYTEEKEAAARRELIEGDALDELVLLAVVMEPRQDNVPVARLCLCSEVATYASNPKWRDFVYCEAHALAVTSGADRDTENKK